MGCLMAPAIAFARYVLSTSRARVACSRLLAEPPNNDHRDDVAMFQMPVAKTNSHHFTSA